MAPFTSIPASNLIEALTAGCVSESIVWEMGNFRITLLEAAVFWMKVKLIIPAVPKSEEAKFIRRPPLDGCRTAEAKSKKRFHCGKLPTFMTSLRHDLMTMAALWCADQGIHFTNLIDGGQMENKSFDSLESNSDKDAEFGEQHIRTLKSSTPASSGLLIGRRLEPTHEGNNPPKPCL